VERSCGPMNKNRIEGVADQGERANSRKALVINGKRRRSGGRAVKECVLTWGDLALCLKGNGVEPGREVSRGRSVRWAAHESGGLKSLRRSEEGRWIQRRGSCLVGQRVYWLEDRVSGAIRNPKGLRRSIGL